VRMRKDGSRPDISLTISPIKNRAGQIIGASKIARDITERKRLQRNLQFLSDASKVLSSSLDYKTTLQTIARLAVSQIADWCAIEMLAEDGSIEQLVVAHVDPQKVQWAWELRKKYPITMDAAYGIPQVLRTGVSEFVPFISEDMLVAAALDDEQLALVRKVGFTSGMTIPIVIDGKGKIREIGCIFQTGRARTVGEGARTRAAAFASKSGVALKISQDGEISVFKRGKSLLSVFAPVR